MDDPTPFLVIPFENKIKKKIIKIEIAAKNEYKSTPGFYCFIRGKSLSNNELLYSCAVICLVRNLSCDIAVNLKSLFCWVFRWSQLCDLGLSFVLSIVKPIAVIS